MRIALTVMFIMLGCNLFLSIIDGMDHKSMYQYVYDNLADHFDKYSVEELITEVEDYNPELLEEN